MKVFSTKLRVANINIIFQNSLRILIIKIVSIGIYVDKLSFSFKKNTLI